MIGLLIFGIVLLTILMIRFKNYLHYLYLVRIPLIGGAILLALPIIAEYVAPQFLQNIFVVESSIQLIIIMFGATLGSIVLVSSIKNISVLIYSEIDSDKSQYLNENQTFRIIRTCLTFALFLPTWISLAFNSLIRNEDPSINWFPFIIGASISLIGLSLAIYYDWRSNKKGDFIQRRKLTYGVQLLIGVAFYLVTIWLNWPNDQGKIMLPNNWQAPTLLYAILIIVGMTLLIGVVGYAIDKHYLGKFSEGKDTSSLYSFRVPVLIVLILFSGLMYGIFGVDHYFKLQPSNLATISYEEDVKTAVGNRLCPEEFQNNQSCQEEQTLVVVAASGGGIQASGWMAQVLAGLQDEKLGIGEDFTKKIGLISSVSGGSVGTMFYLDQFSQRVLSQEALAKEDNTKLTTLVKNATDDWLDSVGWGLAFPDTLRLIGYPLGLKREYKYLDRGYALEKDWQRTLKKPDTTLDDWYAQAINGEIPIPVFNSTIVENGRRFLVSPFKFLPRQMIDYIQPTTSQSNDETQKKIRQSRAFDFRTLYHNCGNSQDQMCTLEVTTASRLSATFPYVSPMARNYPDNMLKDVNGKSLMQNYHMADGGYFDNAGATTALEWLNNLLEKNPELNIKKVVLIQINAFPEEQLKTDQQGNKGFVTVGLGPFTALNGVRNSTQIARNIDAVKLMKSRWGDKGIKIQEFAITFPEKDLEGNKYNQPLSWRLTQTQKKNLQTAWETDETIGNTVKCMTEFWESETGQMKSQKCAEP